MRGCLLHRQLKALWQAAVGRLVPALSLSHSYTPEDVYSVIANLNDYKHFLPWCKESEYLREGQDRSIGRLVVGFPPLVESYTALVLHEPPNFMRVWHSQQDLGSCVLSPPSSS